MGQRRARSPAGSPVASASRPRTWRPRRACCASPAGTPPAPGRPTSFRCRRGAGAGPAAGSEDAQAGLAPHRHLGDDREQVVRGVARAFADLSAFVRPDGVEVAQRDGAERGIGRAQVAQHVLDHALAAAIGIGGRQRMRLGERQVLRLAIDGRGGTEYQPPHARLAHRAQQRHRAAHVVVVVLERVRDRLAHRLAAGQVQDRLHRRAARRRGGQHRRDHARAADVPFHQRDLGSAQALDPAHGLAAAVAEIIQHQRPLAGGQHRHQRVRADVAGAARHQYMQVRHGLGSPHRWAATPGTQAWRGRGACAWLR